MKKIDSIKFLRSIAEKGRKLRRPQFVTFELSYGCNLRCRHCFNPTHQASSRELSLAEIHRILEEIAEMGVFEVCFTGGEPLARPDFFEILEKTSRLGLSMEMNTNGTRISPEIASKLERLGLREIYVSIYGATREVYEAVTGRRGSYDRFLAGVEALSRTSIATTLQMPVMKLNFSEAAAAKELARARGMRFLGTVDIYPRQDGDLGPLHQRLEPEQKAAVLGEIGLLLDHHGHGCGGADTPFFDCDCGKSQFAVTPFGEMNLCTIFPIPKFDLRRGSVKEGWEALKRTVDEARPGANYECPTCDLWSHCRQGRADSWLEKKDLSACLPHYKDLARLEKNTDARAELSREIR